MAKRKVQVKKMLTVSAVSLKYGLPECRVRQLSDAGALPHFRDSNNRRCYDPDAVDRYMKALRQEQAGHGPAAA